jgi:hypothetical protein
MARKIWISSALAAMLALAPATAFAGSPLLSGYGGPGTGEQALLGSTLIGGASGGGAGGSSGSGGSNLSNSAGAPTGVAGGTSSVGSGSTGGVGTGAAGSGSGGTSSNGGASSRSPGHGQSTAPGGGNASAYVYATSQGSVASASPLAGISSGDVLLLIGLLATLGLVAVLTLRLSRLQS